MVVLHQGAIGDFVLALAVVRGACKALQAERVIAVAGATSGRLAAVRGVVDVWKSPEACGLHTLFAEEGEVGPGLRDSLDGAHVLSFLGGDAHITAANLRRSGCRRAWFVDPRPTPETLASGRHITEQWLHVLRERGLAASPARGGVFESVCGDGHVRRTAGKRHGCVLIHPGSGGRAKCWPLERFFGLADRLAPRRVAWMLGPAEVESEGERLAGLRERIVQTGEELVIEGDLVAAAERIGAAALYVGNDAGMTHVAAALGVPTVAIFGPTDPRVWRPLGRDVRAVGPGRAGWVEVEKVLRACDGG